MTLYFTTMIKGLGVAFVSEFCADLCREMGKNSLGEAVQTAGKIEIILLTIPVISEIIKNVSELL